MKISISNLFVYPCLTLMILSCGKIEEKKKEISNSIAEKAMEKVLGTEYDSFETENAGETKVILDFKADNQDLQDFFKRDFTGMVTIVEESLSINCGDETSGGLLLILSNESKQKLNKPIGTNQEGVEATFTVVPSLDPNVGIYGWMGENVDVEVVSLNDEKTIAKVKGLFTSTGSEEKIPFEGTITIEKPIFQVFGGKKENYTY